MPRKTPHTPTSRNPINQGDSKHCPKCRKVKPRTEFYKNLVRYDGLSGYCKSCELSIQKVYARERQSRPLQADAILIIPPGNNSTLFNEVIEAIKTALNGIKGMRYDCAGNQIKTLLKSGQNNGNLPGIINCSVYTVSIEIETETRKNIKRPLEDDKESMEWIREIQDRKRARLINDMRGRV